MMDEGGGRKIAQSNRMCYRYIKMDGVGGRVMMDEGGGRKIAQSNRMCYRYIKMDGVGGRVMRDERGWRKKHNLTECATDISKWMVWEKG